MTFDWIENKIISCELNAVFFFFKYQMFNTVPRSGLKGKGSGMIYMNLYEVHET